MQSQSSGKFYKSARRKIEYSREQHFDRGSENEADGNNVSEEVPSSDPYKFTSQNGCCSKRKTPRKQKTPLKKRCRISAEEVLHAVWASPHSSQESSQSSVDINDETYHSWDIGVISESESEGDITNNSVESEVTVIPDTPPHRDFNRKDAPTVRGNRQLLVTPTRSREFSTHQDDTSAETTPTHISSRPISTQQSFSFTGGKFYQCRSISKIYKKKIGYITSNLYISNLLYSERPITNPRYYPDGEDDLENGWTSNQGIDVEGSSVGPFSGYPGFNYESETGSPKEFFDAFFEKRMFDTIAQQTNNYARSRQNGKFYSVFFSSFSSF